MLHFYFTSSVFSMFLFFYIFHFNFVYRLKKYMIYNVNPLLTRNPATERSFSSDGLKTGDPGVRSSKKSICTWRMRKKWIRYFLQSKWFLTGDSLFAENTCNKEEHFFICIFLLKTFLFSLFIIRITFMTRNKCLGSI